jgi:ABC-type nitrate/sulfonate/bicarbonate transport system substrate-binding protein
MTLAVVLTLVGMLGACGGDDGGAGDGEQTGPVTLKVGIIPIADLAPLYLGMDQGFFEEENLTIEPQFAEGGAAIVTSVVSGDYQIGFSNTTSLIIASTQNVPVQIISQGVLGGATPEEAWDAVLVNALKAVGELTINTALKSEGVDYTTVDYFEVPFPEMIAALEAGDVDAAWVVEPFVTAGKAGGARPILFPYEQTTPNMTIATYFSTRQYI